MAVTSQLTSIENFNGTPSFSSYGGGAGASVNDDVIIEGVQSAGRRVDNTTDKGFGVTFTSVDLSGANEHVKTWVFITHWSEVTQLQYRISAGVNQDDHELPTGEYPPLFGWIPLWLDISRNPEIGGFVNEAVVDEIGILLDIGDVGGNASNLILDEVMHGTSGLLWDGVTGSFADFTSYEATNNEGNVVQNNGVLFVYSRLEIGSSTATTFTDSGFTLIFPDQSLVSDTFMGLTIDLQNASTDIDFSDATIQSADPSGATKRPDLLVTGTSGAFDTSSVSLLGMRLIQLTSACTIDGGIIDALDLTQGSAEIKNATINARAASGVAMCDDATFGTTSGIHDCTIVQADAGHAFELTNTGTITLTGLTFSGFGADGTNSAAIYNDSGGAVTINIGGGGSTPTVRNGTGASTIIQNTVTASVTVRDSSGTAIENARVLVEAESGGNLPVEESVTITRSTTTATVTHTAHGMGTGDKVTIRGANQQDYNGTFIITVNDTNEYTYTVANSPTTPATGTITATGVIVEGLTNASGILENAGFNFTSNQPLVGTARKSSASPYYKPGNISGTLTNSGFSTELTLILDQ